MLSNLPPSAELLLEWDAMRPRSQQAEIGVSDLGGCRRRAGYHLAGYPKATSGSVQAVLGTAAHQAIAQALYALRVKGSIPLHLMIEESVWFGGVLGHLDIYLPPVVRDVKTVGRSQQLDRIRVMGPPRHDLWQVSVYAAAVIKTGRRVERVQLDYIARDSGDSWLWEDSFRMEHVRDAMAWLQMIRDTPLEYLARDFRPDSPQCQACPFRDPCWEGRVDGRDPLSVLFVDDPDVASWWDRLQDARERKRQAEDDEARAKGALDALRPNDQGSIEVSAPGLGDRRIRFTVARGRISPDTEQIRADYARGGAVMPVRTGEPSVRVTLVPAKDHP
jgi:hypothetical protein